MNESLFEEEPLLVDVVHRLVETYQPERLYPFGSVAARGDRGPDSDYDILVVVPEAVSDERTNPLLALKALRGTGLPVDVIVWTRSRFDRRLHVVNSLPATALREGRLLYAA